MNFKTFFEGRKPKEDFPGRYQPRNYPGRYEDVGTPFHGMQPKELKSLSPLAQELYRNIQRQGSKNVIGGNIETGEGRHMYEPTLEDLKKYSKIQARELYKVILAAGDFNFDVPIDIWKLMAKKSNTLYQRLLKAEGLI